jgi:hypothetical protein
MLVWCWLFVLFVVVLVFGLLLSTLAEVVERGIGNSHAEFDIADGKWGAREWAALAGRDG